MHLRLVALALAAACAIPTAPARAQSASTSRHRDRESVVLSAWKPPAGQRCEVADLPRVLPEPAALVDTADLPAYLLQVGALGRHGYALLSLKFDSAGAPRRVLAIESDLPDTIARGVERAVLAALRPQPPGPAYGVRLRVETDSAPVLRVGRSERCEPARVRAVGRGAPPTAVGVVRMSEVGGRTYILRWEVHVDAGGRAVEARLLSAPADAEATERLRNLLLEAQWLPGLDDRVATEIATVVTEQVRTTLAVRRLP